MRFVWVLLLLLLPGLAHAQTLGLRSVLESTSTNHPKVQMAAQKIAAAEGRQLSARGAFDLKLSAMAQTAPVGTYAQNLGQVGLYQPTTLWGAGFFAKYRNGDDHAVYDGKSTTSTGGELALGLLLPLWRDGPIDEARFRRIEADLMQEIAEQEARSDIANVIAEAAASYFKWNLLGAKRNIYSNLLELAVAQSAWLKQQVATGQIASIELADNRRLVAARRARLTRAQLQLRRAALNLGLYHRDEAGKPLPPADASLPAELAPSHVIDENWEVSLIERIDESPDLVVLRTALNLLDRETRLWRNQAAPRVDFDLVGTQSFGAEREYSPSATSLTETTVFGRLSFEFDVQRRKARGKVLQVEAKSRELEAARRFARDRIEVELRAAVAALRAGHEAAQLSREATEAAEVMAEAERERFDLGQSSVLSVNLREAAVLDARITEVESVFAYHVARIELGRLLGDTNIEALVQSPGGAR